MPRTGQLVAKLTHHPAAFWVDRGACALCFLTFMKVVSSIKSAKKRHPDCQVVRRRGKIYVINKTDPRYKARQG